MEGHKVNGMTIPMEVIVTAQRPDIVIIDRSSEKQTVWLFELTCSFEQNFEEAHRRKKIRYTHLASDIEDNGYECKNVPFEVGSRGHLTHDNRASLSLIHKLFSPKLKLKRFLQTVSKISLLCSYHIYNSRGESGWSDPPYLRPYKPSV